MISMDKKYTTRDGGSVELLCTHADGCYSVAALVNGVTETFTDDGYFYGNGKDSPLDLVEVTKYGHIKKGDRVIVDGLRHYFAGVREDGRATTFDHGATEWSSRGLIVSWDNCELAEDDE